MKPSWRASTRRNRQNLSGQINLFDLSDEPVSVGKILPEVEEFDLFQLLQLEKESTGVYLTGHPLSKYRKVIERRRLPEISSFSDEEGHRLDNRTVTLVALVAAKKLKITKQNDTMAFITLEDMTGSMEMLVFPKVLALYSALLREGEAVAVTGRLSTRRMRNPSSSVKRWPVRRSSSLRRRQPDARLRASALGCSCSVRRWRIPGRRRYGSCWQHSRVKRRFTSGSGTAANCCSLPKISGPTSPSRCCAGCVLSWERTAWSTAHSGLYICKSQKRRCSG